MEAYHNFLHCGIVAGVIDQIGLAEQINQELGCHPQEKVRAGTAVKAMILNGLGMVSAPLYLFERFFVGKATEHLLGERARAEHLNDDTFCLRQTKRKPGRVGDQLYEANLTQLFVKIALCAAAQCDVKTSGSSCSGSSCRGDRKTVTSTSQDIHILCLH